MDIRKKVSRKSTEKTDLPKSDFIGPNDAHCYYVNNWLELIL